MTPPFPWSLPPRTARIQAGALLVAFYGLVYGTAAVAASLSRRAVSPMASALVLGVLMLALVAAFIRRDVAWRRSLGLGRAPIGPVLGWGALAFLATYAVNTLLTLGYLASQGGLEAQMAGRMQWLGHLAEVPAGAILPLTIFVGFWEETVFRGFLLGRLRAALPVADTPAAKRWRDALAVAICAVCFGAGHGYQGPLGLMQTTLAGLVLGMLTVWRGSVWPAIGGHVAIDTFGFIVIKALARALGTGAGGGIAR